MNTIIKKLSTKKTIATQANAQVRTQCNYTNNYYGPSERQSEVVIAPQCYIMC